MFLFIFEDGSLGISEDYDDNNLNFVDDGYLSIINMETGQEYYDGEWTDIKKV